MMHGTQGITITENWWYPPQSTTSFIRWSNEYEDFSAPTWRTSPMPKEWRWFHRFFKRTEEPARKASAIYEAVRRIHQMFSQIQRSARKRKRFIQRIEKEEG